VLFRSLGEARGGKSQVAYGLTHTAGTGRTEGLGRQDVAGHGIYSLGICLMLQRSIG
jgi:hypothetical protein